MQDKIDLNIDQQDDHQGFQGLDSYDGKDRGSITFMPERQTSVCYTLEKISSKQTESTMQVQSQSTMNESVLVDQTMPIGSVLLDQQQTSVMQESTIMTRPEQESTSQQNLMDYTSRMPILQQTQYQQIQNYALQIKKVKSALEVLEKRTLIPLFHPLEFVISNQIKMIFGQTKGNQKILTINLIGATFGRNDHNTEVLSDYVKVSSKHAKIVFNNGQFDLFDLGSKRGTFIKVTTNFPISVGQNIYVGDKFAFRILEIQCNIYQILKEEYGQVKLAFTKDSEDSVYSLKLKKGEVWLLGRDKKKNQSCFSLEGYPCHPVMSSTHLEIVYQMNWKQGLPQFYLDDLNSRNGTWIRLSEKQRQSQAINLQKHTIFNLAFEAFYEIVELFHDL